jgi:hypothetical protein
MSARKQQQGKHLSVVSPPQPPALTPARAYADFDKWLALANELREYDGEMWKVLDELKKGDATRRVQLGRDWYVEHRPSDDGSRLLASRPRDQLAAKVAEIRDGERFYNRDELYDGEGLLRPVIAEQVGLLLGSYPNAVPHDPEAYVLMMIEEIALAEPDAIDLEMACRRLRRTLKFPPTIPEVIEAIEKARDDAPPLYLCQVMGKGKEAVILEGRKELETAVAEAKAKLAKPAEAEKKP